MIALIFMCVVALADSGAEWLKRIDQQATVETAHMSLALTVTDSKGRSLYRSMEIWQQGDQSRLVRMIEPTRLKGVGLLVSENDNLHLFLPQYPPARRVLNSNRSDSFLGTDFAIDDLARMSYGTQYFAEYIAKEENGNHLRLTSLQKENKERLHLWVNDLGNVLIAEHYSEHNILNRRIEFSNYKEINGVHMAHTMSVDDLQRKRSTTATIISATINSKFPVDYFTIQHLENP